MSRQVYTQAANPSPYAPPPQPQSYPSYASGQSNYATPPQGPTPTQSYNYGQGPPPPGAQSPYQQYPPAPEHQNSMSVQQPQPSYQQQNPTVMAYEQPHPQGPMSPPMPQHQSSYGPEKGTPPPQGYGQQPAPQQGMNPYGPPGGGKPVDQNGERDWNHDFFGCCDDLGTFCLAYWCPCIVYQQVKQRIHALQTTGRADPQRGGSGCGGDCFLYGCLTGCCGLGWVFQIGTRSAIRTRYKIRGGGCTDCLAAACCYPCDLTQESRELELEENQRG